MSGGIGSRFWPYSRTARPQTVSRLFRQRPLTTADDLRQNAAAGRSPERIIVVTNDIYGSLVAEQLPELPAATF
mgnify:CR=1 FL=1